MTTRALITLINILFLSTGSSAWAGNEANQRRMLFEADKSNALATFDASHQQACLTAFRARYESKYSFGDALAFNEAWSQAAYDTLFWKGNGDAPRGVIFTGAITDAAGAEAGRLACYYAMTDGRLDFQSAYVLPAQPGEAKTASRDISIASRQ